MNERTTKGTEDSELRRKLNDLTKSVIGAAIEFVGCLARGINRFHKPIPTNQVAVRDALQSRNRSQIF